jgi:hypothetical protein
LANAVKDYIITHDAVAGATPAVPIKSERSSVVERDVFSTFVAELYFDG